MQFESFAMLIGGLGLFFVGMRMLSSNLKQLIRRRFKSLAHSTNAYFSRLMVFSDCCNPMQALPPQPNKGFNARSQARSRRREGHREKHFSSYFFSAPLRLEAYGICRAVSAV